MINLTVNDKKYGCQSEETVLDALLRQDVNVSYGCKQGHCHSCMLQSLHSLPSESAQKGLKDTLKHQGYFLGCLCVPAQDMSIKLPRQSDFYTDGKVVINEMLNRNTILLVLECPDVLEYKAGQFVNLQREDGLTRSYSIANIPTESKTVEFHIRRLPEGSFSGWVHDTLKVGDVLSVSEPQGHCFYLPDRKEDGLLLVGTGSGLAPLAGIIMDALSHGHQGKIHLFHGSSELEDLYRIEEMRQLEHDHENFSYTACISGEHVPEGFSAGRANEVALKDIANLAGWRVFLCGHPEMITQMKTASFLAGAASTDIYTDAFLVAQKEA